MIDFYLVEWLKWRKSRVSLIVYLTMIIYSLFMVLIMVVNKSYLNASLNFTDLMYQSNILITTVVGPLFYGSITIYYFYLPIKEKTERTVKLLPISQSKIFVTKLLFLLSIHFLLGFILIISNILFAFLFSFKGINGQSVLSALYQTNTQVILMFMLQMPIVFFVLFFRNKIIPFSAIVVSLLGIITVVDSAFSYIYPYTAVYAFVEGSKVTYAYLSYRDVPYVVGLYALCFFSWSLYKITHQDY